MYCIITTVPAAFYWARIPNVTNSVAKKVLIRINNGLLFVDYSINSSAVSIDLNRHLLADERRAVATGLMTT